MGNWIRPAKLPTSHKGKFSLNTMRMLSRLGKHRGHNYGKKAARKKREMWASLKKSLYRE